MIRLLVLAACLAALPGCALLRPQATGQETPSPEMQAAWRARVAQLAPVDRFTVQGRVASGALGFKADLRWKQFSDGRFEMRISGPFGARAAELAGDGVEVRVRTGDEAITTTADPEAWLEQALGVRLPVRGLRWWALGLPDPASVHRLELDPQGRARQIVQNGWELTYPEYRVLGPFDLPRRIEARNGDARVLVLADTWGGLAAPAIVAQPLPLD